MEFTTRVCDCGQRHEKIVGRVIVKVDLGEINAEFDACEDMLNRVTAALAPDHPATSRIGIAVTKLNAFREKQAAETLAREAAAIADSPIEG